MLKKEFTLRPYQNAFITNLGHAVKEYRRVIACAATGAGKSKTFLRIAVNAINKGYTVLVITESRKIYNQLIAEVHAVEIKANSKLRHILPGSVYLAMAQTLRRRPWLIDQYNKIGERLLIINDECHINEATNVLLQLPAAMLIGFSGSPVGKHLVKLYNHLVVGPQPHELVLAGFLSPYKHFERKRADISQLELDSIGEYTEESQERVFSTSKVYDGLIEDLKTIQFKKGLIYTSSIHHCEQVADMLRDNSYACVTVHSKVDDYAKQKGLFNNVRPKRDQSLEEAYLEQFTDGLIPLCVSVGILTKGFDCPPIDLIVFLLKTRSLAKYLQCIGRGSRTLPGEELLPIEQRKKQYFTVLDYGQNCDGKAGHLPWDFERDWQTLWRSKPKRAGVSPIKVCPQCDYVNAASAKQCANCGCTWMVLNTEEEPDNTETILVEITAKYNKLVGRLLSTLTAEELATYSKSKGKKQLAIRVAKWNCFSNGMDGAGGKFLHDFAKQMGYKIQWVRVMVDSMREVLRCNPDETFEFNDQTLR